ncbi:MAG: MltA domain-containing protein [Brevundimonas sp.]|uniref:MltA domain-containing protein n=1 Tax=Brevundimonas sp. TaxID=1871086 RepID=UPI002729147A|nr:MltA domain-containing protein [Brevundimonas sp.]MDO9077779.1 MltA domain-containing protein [Brevundimonas sp.]MDP3080139.1 MltA domain-containing protein [Brevundimonas sp.]MDZ4060335.1 MltA domain-containing protein [Brevundimonas sp.]
MIRGGARRRGFSAPAVLVGLALTLAACATTPVAPPVPPATDPTVPAPTPDPAPAPEGQSPATLPGWNDEDHLAAFEAWAVGCTVARDAAARVQCARAMHIKQTSKPVTPTMARAFLESGFTVVAARTADGGPGLLTAYFAPEYTARRMPDAEFDMPVRPRPAGWARGDVGAVRADIEAAPATDTLAWMRAEDLFFMQIQGSGYLTFEDGSTARAAYAADNGRPFTGIARPMAEQGLLPANGTSGEAIRAWLAAHRGPEARAVMALNPRYIFFAVEPDDGGHPNGAAGIPLTARRSIAVDPAHWRYGDLVWISADGGNLVGARASYQGLVVALDTGSAIRGPVRADFYMGRGPAAGEEAGAVRHPLRMWRLVPRP